MAFDRLADGIIRHHKAIIAVWVVILVCAAPLAIKALDSMSYDVNDMAGEDSESIQGYAVISEYFPSSSTDISSTPVLVIQYDDESGQEAAEALIEALNAAAGDYVTDDGVNKLDTSLVTGAFVSVSTTAVGDDGGVILIGVIYNSELTTGDDAEISISDDTGELRDFINSVLEEQIEYAESMGDTALASALEEIGVYLTGSPAITYDMMEGAMDDISKIDPFTILLILVLVGLFFRSFISAATPPVTIGVAFVVVLALIYGVSFYLDVFFITEIMLLVSMMGAGCDYCIFIIARYREELRSGKEHEAALHDAIKWAGESISVSAASVIIGFGAMSICSYSLVSTLGLCLALGIIVALFAALTLIPAVLAAIGDRIFWPTRMDSYKEGGKATKGWYAWFANLGAKYFDKSARFSKKHAKAIVAVAIVVTIPAAYIALTAETSYDLIGSLQNGDSGEGMDIISDYADAGMLMPNYVVLEYDDTLATISYDSTTGMYTLVWADDWDTTYTQLQDLVQYIYEQDGGEDGNIGTATLPFMWEAAVEEAYATLGSSATGSEIIEYIEANSSTEVAQVLAIIIPTMSEQFIEQYGSSTIAAMYYMITGVLVTTEDEVEDAMLSMMVSSYLMDTVAPIMDYYVNVQCGIVGGDYASSEDGAGTVTYIKLSIPTQEGAMSNRSMESISVITDAVDQYVEDNDNVLASWVTGTAAVMYEVSVVISGEFTTIEVLVVVLIIILLFFVMRSYTIPFRSVLTILMSIMWTLALTHVVFGNLLGGEVTWLIPLILLVICLGLGMDYDILLTTRIKENVKSKGMSNDDAIHHAVTHTGSVITICGLIMGGAFGTLMLSSMEMLQEFGFALCFAILVDALVVRTYVVPAVMHLLGDWNWKGPKFMQGKGKNKESGEDATEAEAGAEAEAQAGPGTEAPETIQTDQ